jgi:hypothetical protein
MEQRRFFVALSVPRGADRGAVREAYRKVVTRYRGLLQEQGSGEAAAGGGFVVARDYSERRHAAIMDLDEPPAPAPAGEVDRFFGGVVPELLPGPRARQEGKDLFVELRMSPERARSGGLFPLHVPVVRPCPACQELDEPQRLSCRVCGGRGRVTDDHVVEVTVPPGVEDGQEARVAMEDVGLGATDLLVHVVVSRPPE